MRNTPGLKPKLADKELTIVTVDDSPDALEGIKDGKVLECHSQGFWLQGYLPMEILYFDKKMGMYPLDDVLTGPVVIDQSNVDQWIKFVKSVIREEAYRSSSPGKIDALGDAIHHVHAKDTYLIGIALMGAGRMARL